MKIKLILLLYFLVITAGGVLHSQICIPNKAVNAVCYAGSKVNRIYIPPPKGSKVEAKGLKSGNITVLYNGFTGDAKAAVEYACSILEAFLPPDLDLTVKASWTKISDQGVLGNSRSTAFVGGWAIDAQNPYAYYPIGLAEKINGKKLNEDWEADIELVINSSSSWYTGLDGNTPVRNYDLVTVILHELMHGLGFFDSMGTDGSVAWYGLGSIPLIYDTFVEDLNGNKLTDTLAYEQNSANLYLSLTGGQLYFKGPLSDYYSQGSGIRLYVPSRWDDGSSVSHLDEALTRVENSLMTPFINLGEAIHDPGLLTLSIFGDLGWINTRILHQPPDDTEELISSLELSLEIISDTSYNEDRVVMAYSFNDFITTDSIYMVQGSTRDSYVGTVNIPSYNTRLSYYFIAEDGFGRVYRSPALGQIMPNHVYIGTDTVKPLITHTPEEYFFEEVDSLLFVAHITDNIGIDTAYLELKINNGEAGYCGLLRKENDEFILPFHPDQEIIRGGDSIQYRIVAVDESSRRNTRTSPENGYYTLYAEELKSVLSQYHTNFEGNNDDFFNIGFEITDFPEFSSPALHSEHPYRSPEEDNKNLEFISVLKHPIIFDQSGMVIKFREIVLVEPGEDGSVYGFSDFYDYVVLEGSKDFGRNWFSIADGYDCRQNIIWENAYNSSIDGMNSTYQAKESMFIDHILYPRLPDKISSGDSLLFRFRLFSDPYANGWGWVIDDLDINPLVDRIENPVITEDVRFYPNPGNGLVKFRINDSRSYSTIKYSIYTVSGTCLVNKQNVGDSDFTLDISSYPSGIYIIVLNLDNKVRTSRYSLIR